MIAKIAMHRVCVHASILEWTRVRRDGPRAARARQDLCVRYPRAPPSSILSVFSCPPGSEGPIASCSTGVSLSQFVCRVRLHGGAPKPLAPCTSHPQRFQFDTPNLNTLTVSSDASEIRDKKKRDCPSIASCRPQDVSDEHAFANVAPDHTASGSRGFVPVDAPPALRHYRAGT